MEPFSVQLLEVTLRGWEIVSYGRQKALLSPLHGQTAVRCTVGRVKQQRTGVYLRDVKFVESWLELCMLRTDGD